VNALKFRIANVTKEMLSTKLVKQLSSMPPHVLVLLVRCNANPSEKTQKPVMSHSNTLTAQSFQRVVLVSLVSLPAKPHSSSAKLINVFPDVLAHWEPFWMSQLENA